MFLLASANNQISAQPMGAKPNFEDRLTEIEAQLNLLADSTILELNSKVNFSVSGVPLNELLRGVAQTNGLNIALDPSLNLKVLNTFTDVPVKDLILFLCREYRLDIRFVNKIISIYPYIDYKEAPKNKEVVVRFDRENKLLTVDLRQDSLSAVVKKLTQITGSNILAMPEVANVLLSGYISNLPLKSALEKMAVTNGLKLKVADEGVYIFEGQPQANIDPNMGGQQYTNANRRNNQQNNYGYSQSVGSGDLIVNISQPIGKDSLLDIDAVNASIMEIIKRGAEQLGKSYILQNELQGNITCHIKGVKFIDLLALLLLPSNYSFSYNQGIYILGDKKLDGLRDTELIKLKFRSVADIDKVLPTDLMAGLELKIFKDLNALIVSGSRLQLERLKKFVNQIDEPVPNIMIEVIVAELRKGFSIQTGLTAFLSDSTVKTGGQVFPGIDLTLSSNSINNALGDWATKGWVNIGKVTPNFYAKLEALEQNNFLNLRSTPKLATLNGSEANLKIGSSVYYKIETQNVSGGVSPIITSTPNFQSVEANMSIKINPVVSGNEHITLDITAEFSNFIEPEIEDAPPGNSTRQFTSKIRIRNEEMIILGGLEETRKAKGGSGVPWLSRIPVLKWIFSRKFEETSDDQLIVFIKPTIVY